jgi:FkbM family methyltransferase
MPVKRRIPSHGVDSFRDIARRLPRLEIKTVFDIGANMGQSAGEYLARFPQAQIYSFEPVGRTFRCLRDNLGSHGNVHLFQLALGAAKGKGKMVLEGSSDRFFLAKTARDLAKRNEANIEVVNLETLDHFCVGKKIARINYLKIDAEGADLDVLKGAKSLLNRQRVDLVEVEAGMNRRNKRHVRFEVLKAFLEGKGYFLFGIYQQVSEWITQEPNLRRANLVFISQNQIDANKGAGGWRRAVVARPRAAV